MSEEEPVRGWCEREVQQELPGLGLMCTTIDLAQRRSLTGNSPPAVLARLRELSNRWRGARAVNVRQEPIPAAYRVFFRHIGLDPDVSRTPIEAVVLERMLDGGFLSEGLLADILTIGLIDTAVPVWALDADTVNGPLGIRVSRAEERLGRGLEGPSLGGGRLVIADADSPLAILFGQLAPDHQPSSQTRRLVLFAVQVAGVPALHAEETLWACRSALSDTEGH
jgi:DNA/RNA-binding domain of Phe-tRNA-synthetase-like protein